MKWILDMEVGFFKRKAVKVKMNGVGLIKLRVKII